MKGGLAEERLPEASNKRERQEGRKEEGDGITDNVKLRKWSTSLPDDVRPGLQRYLWKGPTSAGTLVVSRL